MGPYQNERDTYTEPMIVELDTPVTNGTREAVRLQHLLKACAEAGIELGAYDLRTLRWAARSWEASSVQAIIGLISRANKP